MALGHTKILIISFIFFALVAHTEIKYGIGISRSSSLLDMIEPFFIELCGTRSTYAPLKNSNYLQFAFIFSAKIAHTEMKFGIQIYHPIMYVQGGISVLQTSLVSYIYSQLLLIL
jgi:hypothetical protein